MRVDHRDLRARVHEEMPGHAVDARDDFQVRPGIAAQGHDGVTLRTEVGGQRLGVDARRWRAGAAAGAPAADRRQRAGWQRPGGRRGQDEQQRRDGEKKAGPAGTGARQPDTAGKHAAAFSAIPTNKQAGSRERGIGTFPVPGRRQPERDSVRTYLPPAPTHRRRNKRISLVFLCQTTPKLS